VIGWPTAGRSLPKRRSSVPPELAAWSSHPSRETRAARFSDLVTVAAAPQEGDRSISASVCLRLRASPCRPPELSLYAEGTTAGL
jgi:hypothetical protein